VKDFIDIPEEKNNVIASEEKIYGFGRWRKRGGSP
jgi:hypothetical protein